MNPLTWMNVRNALIYDVLPVVAVLVLALLVHRLSDHIARWLLPVRQLARRPQTQQETARRRQTLADLLSGIISALAGLVATFFLLMQFVTPDTLLWMIGLFGVGFGFSAKPFISDVMSGFMFIIDDPFDVGEKVQILEIEGYVEDITLRMTTLRGMSGEVFMIPNGEIRQIRNFSRGRFTPVKVVMKVPGEKLRDTVAMLEILGHEARESIPALMEPWRVIASEGRVAQNIELTVVAKAEFGKGVEVHPQILAFIRERLDAQQIPLID